MKTVSASPFSKAKFGVMAVVCLSLFAGLLLQSIRQNQKILESHGWVKHTLEIQELGNILIANVTEGSAAVRGFLLTQNPDFLTPYDHMRATLLSQYAHLSTLTHDNPAQQERLGRMHFMLEQRLAISQTQINNADDSPEAIKKSVDNGRQLNQNITALMDEIQQEEARLLQQRETTLTDDARTSLLWNIGILVTLFAAIAILAWQLFKELQKRQHLIEELKHVNVEMEHTNANLQTANQAILEADRLKTEFLSAMSHELRTPLNSIIGFTGLLRMGIVGALNAEQSKQLGMINDSAQHLLHLISDLLDLSRIETGRAELSSEEFDLHDLIKEVLAVVSPLAAKKNLRLHPVINATAIILRTDRRKVYQILLNLVSNAIKFSEHGEVKVSCQRQGDYWRITVSDQGIGIKPESIGMLFQAFRQVDGSAKRIYEGTGLGLYLSKKLLEMLGGQIDVRSQPGTGSEFYFTLPAMATD